MIIGNKLSTLSDKRTHDVVSIDRRDNAYILKLETIVHCSGEGIDGKQYAPITFRVDTYLTIWI